MGVKMAKNKEIETNDKNTTNEIDKKEKKPFSVGKFIINLFIITILVPLVILSGLYFVNDNFKQTARSVLSGLPSPIGDYFSGFPTPEEMKGKLSYIADYYLELDYVTAAEKLSIVKNNDEQIYYEIIQNMREKSYKRTEEIVGKVQVLDLKNKTLNEIYSEIEGTKDSEITAKANELTSLDKYYAVKYIVNNYLKTKDLETLVKIFKKMDINAVANILYDMELDNRVQILNNLDRSYRASIDAILYQKEAKEKQLVETASVYEVKDLEKAIKDLSNADTYPIEDLVTIYRNLSTEKAARVLMASTDDDFKKDLLNAIRENEKIDGKSPQVSVNVEKTINFLQQYNKKIKELADIYDKMNAADAAKIVEKMMISEVKLDTFDLNDLETFTITDDRVILDILKNIKKTQLSNIVNQLDTRKATEITRILATK